MDRWITIGLQNQEINVILERWIDGLLLRDECNVIEREK